MEQSLVYTAAVEIQAVVRVANDVLDYEYNHDARTQSSRISADRLHVSGNAGSNLETKKSSALDARLSWLPIIRTFTHSSKQHWVGCLVEKVPREESRDVSSRPY